MQQLSGTDNIMLFAETNNVYNHVGSLIVYDATTARGGGVRFKDILRHFEERLHVHPLFRRRLVQVPYGVDRPYWVADEHVDVEYHIRHIALPRPGDWRQLMIQVARLHSRPLDRARPLWEAYVIEGLDNIPNLPPGAFAVFLKIHHAVVDGMAAVRLMSELHTLAPDAVEQRPVPQTVVVDRDPTSLELVARSVNSGIRRVTRLAGLSARIGTRLLAAARTEWPAIARGDLAQIVARGAALLPAPAPATRFSKPVSPHRVIEAFGMPLSRIGRVRAKVPGATVNDVFVAVAGGAVRKYLESKGELTDESLAALMPIALRSDGSEGGNDVAGVPVFIRTDIADPIERLQAVRAETVASKARAEKMGLDLLKNLLDTLPPAVAGRIVDSLLTRRINLTVSNVRGPAAPMYLAGAKAMCTYPISIPADGVGVNFTGASYNGVLWVSMVACRSMVPDSGVMLHCMRESWDELLAAADPPAVADSARPKRVGRHGKTRRGTARSKRARRSAGIDGKRAG